MFKKGDKVRFTRVNPNGGEKYGKEGDVATVLVPVTGYSHEYTSNQAEVDLPGCDIEPNVPWSVLELVSNTGPVRTVTRQEIIPGTYDGVSVQRYAKDPSGVIRVSLFAHDEMHRKMTAAELDRAAAVLTALAGALRDGE
jgi:hypothetical protein